MKIERYTFAWNEELILPHFLRYSTQFCDKIITLWDAADLTI